MSYGPTFQGSVLTPAAGISPGFEIVDILAKGKWLKADSVAASIVYSNLQLVQAAREFAYYRHSEQIGDTDEIARKYMPYGKRFQFQIRANFHELNAHGTPLRTLYVATLDCSGCELIFSTGSPRSYGIRFDTATLSQRAVSQEIRDFGHHHGHGRRGWGRYGYGDAYGHNHGYGMDYGYLPNRGSDYGRGYDYRPQRHQHGRHR